MNSELILPPEDLPAGVEWEPIEVPMVLRDEIEAKRKLVKKLRKRVEKSRLKDLFGLQIASVETMNDNRKVTQKVGPNIWIEQLRIAERDLANLLQTALKYDLDQRAIQVSAMKTAIAAQREVRRQHKANLLGETVEQVHE